MPKVTQQHRDARRDQILEAARGCFLRKGFQATSMQDLLAASGMSSGAFYLYFASKDDVILAIVEENMAAVLALLRAPSAIGAPTGGPGDALAAIVETVRERCRSGQLPALAVLAWAEALRSPALHARFAERVRGLRSDLAGVIADAQAGGAFAEKADPVSLARLVVALIPGLLLQSALLGDDATDGVAETLRTLCPD